MYDHVFDEVKWINCKNLLNIEKMYILESIIHISCGFVL